MPAPRWSRRHKQSDSGFSLRPLRAGLLSSRNAGDLQVAVASVSEIRKARDSGSNILDLAAVIAPLNDDLIAEPGCPDVDAAEGKKLAESGAVDGARGITDLT